MDLRTFLMVLNPAWVKMDCWSPGDETSADPKLASTAFDPRQSHLKRSLGGPVHGHINITAKEAGGGSALGAGGVEEKRGRGSAEGRRGKEEG